MQKWFMVVLMAVGLSGIAQAQGSEGGSPGTNATEEVAAPPQGAPQAREDGRRRPPALTRERFMERQKRMTERRGQTFDPAVAEARFDELDKNKDGILTRDEMGRGRGPEGRRPSGPVTKERFVARQKMMAERAGEEFDPAAADARFAELDKNQDGVLTPSELPMGRPRMRENSRAGGGTPADEAEGVQEDGAEQGGDE